MFCFTFLSNKQWASTSIVSPLQINALYERATTKKDLGAAREDLKSKNNALKSSINRDIKIYDAKYANSLSKINRNREEQSNLRLVLESLKEKSLKKLSVPLNFFEELKLLYQDYEDNGRYEYELIKQDYSRTQHLLSEVAREQFGYDVYSNYQTFDEIKDALEGELPISDDTLNELDLIYSNFPDLYGNYLFYKCGDKPHKVSQSTQEKCKELGEIEEDNLLSISSLDELLDELKVYQKEIVNLLKKTSQLEEKIQINQRQLLLDQKEIISKIDEYIEYFLKKDSTYLTSLRSFKHKSFAALYKEVISPNKNNCQLIEELKNFIALIIQQALEKGTHNFTKYKSKNLKTLKKLESKIKANITEAPHIRLFKETLRRAIHVERENLSKIQEKDIQEQRKKENLKKQKRNELLFILKEIKLKENLAENSTIAFLKYKDSNDIIYASSDAIDNNPFNEALYLLFQSERPNLLKRIDCLVLNHKPNNIEKGLISVPLPSGIKVEILLSTKNKNLEQIEGQIESYNFLNVRNENNQETRTRVNLGSNIIVNINEESLDWDSPSLPRIYGAASYALQKSRSCPGYEIFALLVAPNGSILSYGINEINPNRQAGHSHCATAHAEVNLCKSLVKQLSTTDYNSLPQGITLRFFTTLRPCNMCANFIHSLLDRVFIGKDFKIQVYFAQNDPGQEHTCLDDGGCNKALDDKLSGVKAIRIEGSPKSSLYEELAKQNLEVNKEKEQKGEKSDNAAVNLSHPKQKKLITEAQKFLRKKLSQNKDNPNLKKAKEQIRAFLNQLTGNFSKTAS